MARELGAEVVLNYKEDPEWSKSIYKLTAKRGVDVVVDNIGQATWKDSLRAVARGGREMVISTQAQNVRSQRVWTRLGYRPILALTTVHAMLART